MPMVRSPTAFGEDSYDQTGRDEPPPGREMRTHLGLSADERELLLTVTLLISPLSPLRSLGPTARRTR